MAHNFTWDRAKWEALPWFDQRLYVEELARRGLLDEGGDFGDGDTGEQSLDDLAAGGMTVERG